MDLPPRISDLVCPVCGYQFETTEDRDAHEPCPETDEPTLVTQCPARESGGVQCEAFVAEPDDGHGHFVTQATIDRHLR